MPPPPRPELADASWRLKLDRAKEHLRDMDDELWRYIGRHSYEAFHRPKSKREPGNLFVHLRVTEQPPDRLAILAGDAIHNMRSALDHLAVAVAPRKRRWSASFPILLEAGPQRRLFKFLRRDNGKAWQAFAKATKGTPKGAVTNLKRLQPFNYGEAGREHPLALISQFDNADKHRQLVPFVSGLVDANTILVRESGEAIGALRFRQFVEDGARLMHVGVQPLDRPTKVQVQVEGRLEVAIKIGATGRYVSVSALSQWVDYIRLTVLPALEPYAKP